MTSGNNYLGVILVIAITIVAHFARRYRKQHRGRPAFSYATLPPPRARDRHRHLRHARAHGDPRPELRSPGRGLAEKGLGGAPSTYAIYLAIYRGLSSTDATLLTAADAYVEVGRQSMALTAPGPHGSDLASLGNTLMGMAQLRLVVRAVHRLGVVLDLE